MLSSLDNKSLDITLKESAYFTEYSDKGSYFFVNGVEYSFEVIKGLVYEISKKGTA